MQRPCCLEKGLHPAEPAYHAVNESARGIWSCRTHVVRSVGATNGLARAEWGRLETPPTHRALALSRPRSGLLPFRKAHRKQARAAVG